MKTLQKVSEFMYPEEDQTLRVINPYYFGNGSILASTWRKKPAASGSSSSDFESSWGFMNLNTGQFTDLAINPGNPSKPFRKAWVTEDGFFMVAETGQFKQYNSEGVEVKSGSNAPENIRHRSVISVYDKITKKVFSTHSAGPERKMSIIDPESLQTVNEIVFDNYIKNEWLSSRSEYAKSLAVQYVDENFVYIQVETCLFIYDKKKLIDGSKTVPTIVYGKRYPTNSYTMQVNILGFHGDLMYVWIESTMKNGYRVGAAISKKHLLDIAKTAPDTTILYGATAQSNDLPVPIDSEKYPEEFTFSYAPWEPQGQKSYFASPDRIAFSDMSYGSGEISCINDNFPVVRRRWEIVTGHAVSYNNPFFFLPENHTSSDKFTHTLGNHNVHFFEITPFYMQPLPVIDEATKRLIVSNYTGKRSSFDTANMENMHRDPSHFTKEHLHMFDAAKYVKYKLIFHS